jgi:hypothetical protein
MRYTRFYTIKKGILQLSSFPFLFIIYLQPFSLLYISIKVVLDIVDE